MLSNLQKQILEATLDYLFDDLINQASSTNAVLALRAVTEGTIYRQHETLFIELSVLDSIDELRRIYHHRCPQNRAVTNPYLGQEEGMAVWRDTLTQQIRREPLGILGLTAQADSQIAPVTAEDVKNYTEELIQNHITHLQQSIIQQTPTSAPNLPEAQPMPDTERLELAFFRLSDEALLQKAQMHLQERQHFKALGYINQLVNRNPQHSEYLFLQGQSLSPLRRREEALVAFNQALRFANTNNVSAQRRAQMHVERGFTLENLHAVTGAFNDYHQALQLNPRHAFALSQRAGLYMQQQKIDLGNQDYLASLAIKEDATTYRNRGEWLLVHERYEEAIADFNDALRLRPHQRDVEAMKQEAEHLLSQAQTPSSSNCLLQ